MRPSQAGKLFEGSMLEELRATVALTGKGYVASFNDRITWTGRRIIKHPTPTDIIFIHPIVNLLIECKAVVMDRPNKKFAFTQVKAHQREDLERFTLAGSKNLGVVAINFHYPRQNGREVLIVPYWALELRPRSVGPDVNPEDYRGLWGPPIRSATGLTTDMLRQLRNVRRELGRDGGHTM